MSTVVHIDPAGRRASDRDWLDRPSSHGLPRAQVVEFTPRIARCSICSDPRHRAHRCPQRTGARSND